MQPIRKILHPTDFSKSAEPALELAINLAHTYSAELTVLHVYAVPIYMGPFGDGYTLQPELVQKLKEEADRAMQVFRQRAAQAGVRIQTLTVEGIVSEVIVAEAEARGMDLVVMGTHGRTGFKHLLLGSVAERVLRQSPIPILTVRASTEVKADL